MSIFLSANDLTGWERSVCVMRLPLNDAPRIIASHAPIGIANRRTEITNLYAV